MSKPKIMLSLRFIVFLILLTNIIPPLAVDEYTPSLPHMVQDLHTTPALMQLSVSFYMLTFCISQLIGGFLSDGLGRRPVLIWSLPLFIIGCIITAFADSAFILNLGRLVQGLGVGICALTGPAIMSDCFQNKPDELAKISGYYSTVYSVIPISAPILGGYIQQFFGWRANFIFLLIVGIFIWIIFYAKLPETHQPSDAHKISWQNVVKNYGQILSHKKFMLAVLCMLLIWTMFIVFSVMAPFVIQTTLGFSAAAYGWFALLVGVGFFVGNTLNNILLKHMASERILVMGLAAMVLCSLVFFVITFLGKINIWSVMVPVFAIMTTAGAAFPNLYPKAIGSAGEYGGLAGALIGSLILLGAVIITALITQFHAHSPVIMAFIYVIMTVCALAINHLNHD